MRWTARPVRHQSAPLDLCYISPAFRSGQMDPDDSVALMRLDGTSLIREPSFESAAGKSLSQAPLFTKLILRSQSGTSEAVSLIGGQDRLYAYQRVLNLLLMIPVTQNRADALAARASTSWVAPGGMVGGT